MSKLLVGIGKDRSVQTKFTKIRVYTVCNFMCML